MKLIPQILIGMFLLFISCTFPKDPHETFLTSKEEGLRIGVVHNPPYTIITDSTFSGKEITLLSQFCKKEQLSYHFATGTETALIRQLKAYQLDVVVGGFTKTSLWKEEVGMTKPYDRHHVFFVPKGENRLVYELETFLHQNYPHGK